MPPAYAQDKIILGIAALVAVVSHAFFCQYSTADIALHIFSGFAFVAAGIGYLVAGAKRYRGHWSFVIGMALMVVGFIGLGVQIDNARTGQSEDLWYEIGCVLFFLAFGALSLWSGHKLHRCSLELERAKHGHEKQHNLAGRSGDPQVK